MTVLKKILVLDACVIIDLCLEDACILRLVADALGQVVVLSPILSEVDQLDETEVGKLNLTLIEPELDLVVAASIRQGGLSFRDRLCLLFSKTVGATLYTNDKALVNAAQSEGVDVKWGLEILLELVALGHLARPASLILLSSGHCIKRTPSHSRHSEGICFLQPLKSRFLLRRNDTGGRPDR